MLFDTSIRRHRSSVSAAVHRRSRATSSASIYDNVIVSIPNGHVSKQRRDELLHQQQRHSATQHRKTGFFYSERMERCKNCCKSVTTFIFSRVGLCLLVVAYAFGGGVVFQFLEGPHEGTVTDGVQRRLHITVEKLFNNSEQSRVLFKNNWTAMARNILEEYQRDLVHRTKRGYHGERFEGDSKQWTFPGAILYAITVITTIGYGHITCKTNEGKIVTMIYAIFGIPLMLLCLANIGSTMADAFRFIYCNVCCSYCNLVKKRRNLRALKSVELSHNTSSTTNTLSSDPSKNIETHSSANVVEFVDNFNVDYRKQTIPISVTLSLLSSYLILGAVLFSEWENWKLLDGAYFCFVTLATIGLGDLVPGKSITSSTTSTQVEGKLVICALYVLFGLSLMAMCFNLMQEEVRAKFRRLGNKLGIIDDPNFW